MDLNSSLNFKSLKIDFNTCNDEEIIISLNKTSKASNHMVSLNNTVKMHKEIYIYTNLSTILQYNNIPRTITKYGEVVA